MKNEKLFKDFIEMVNIPSPSKNEKQIYHYLINKLKKLGLKVKTDSAGKKIGSNANNIYAYLKGNSDNKKGIVLSVHMDTVTPAKSQNPQIEGSYIKSDGKSVLGGDDKAGIAIVFEVLRNLKNNDIEHGDIEVVITIAEEIGLKGAKNFNVEYLKNKEALIFDMDGIDKIAYASIGQKQFELIVKGKSAHAGMAPEKGINAIKIASEIICEIKSGKIDSETTCNVGKIKGGEATNIVPDKVVIEGEVRSHNPDKIDYYINKIIESCWKAERKFKQYGQKDDYPIIDYKIIDCFKPFEVDKDSKLVKDLIKAGKNLNRKQTLLKNNGGNDGNIFHHKGIKSVVLGIGMEDVHSKKEKIDYNNMKKVVELVIEFINCR